MGAKFTVNGENVTISFEWTLLIQDAMDIVYVDAEKLWINEFDIDGNVTNPYEDSTPQERLNVVYGYVQKVLVNMANAHSKDKAMILARETAKTYSLGEEK